MPDDDGYSKSAITSTLSGINKADPNYSSQEIGIEDFQIIKVIGRGSFGKVYLVQKKDTQGVFAMKTLKKDMVLRKGQTTNTRGKLDDSTACKFSVYKVSLFLLNC